MRNFRVVLVLFFCLGQFSALAPTTTAQALSDTDAAANMTIELSKYEETGNTRSLYDRMHSDSKAEVPYSAMEGWYRSDFFPLQPRAITTITSVEFVTWTWTVTGQTYENTAEVTFVQPFGSPVSTVDTYETVRLVKEGRTWKWFFGRSADFVEEQIRKYPETSSNQSRNDASSRDNPNRPPRNRVEGSSQGTLVPGLMDSALPEGCTLVELYPGYPMYRGNVTGVIGHWGGLGDFQCLEILEDNFPRFNKSAEDRANRNAARQLGIDGEPHQWTWENWMQIEATRGHIPACYSCLMMSSDTVPLIPDLRPNPQDPRIRLGFLGEDDSIRRNMQSLGLQGDYYSMIDFFDGDSYELRAAAYSYNLYSNADELLNRFEEIFIFLRTAIGDDLPGPPIYQGRSGDYIYWMIWESGGYTWVPEVASPGDQVILLAMGAYSIDNRISSAFESSLHSDLDKGIQDWLFEGRPVPLAQFLREKGYLSGWY